MYTVYIPANFISAVPPRSYPKKEMKQVYASIREVLVTLRGGERSGLEDEVVTRRRSIASIEG